MVHQQQLPHRTLIFVSLTLLLVSSFISLSLRASGQSPGSGGTMVCPLGGVCDEKAFAYGAEGDTFAVASAEAIARCEAKKQTVKELVDQCVTRYVGQCNAVPGCAPSVSRTSTLNLPCKVGTCTHYFHDPGRGLDGNCIYLYNENGEVIWEQCYPYYPNYPPPDPTTVETIKWTCGAQDGKDIANIACNPSQP